MKKLYIGQRVYLKKEETYGTVMTLAGEAAEKGGLRFKFIRINVDNGVKKEYGQPNPAYNGYVEDRHLENIQEIDGIESDGNCSKKIKELEKKLESMQNTFLNHAHKVRRVKGGSIEDLTSKPKKA